MTAAQQWIANQTFLDRVARGDIFRLSNPLSELRPGSAALREIAYILSKGYAFSADGMQLVPPGLAR